nr:MAG TPA: hypothetical protein [Caudoviricetes sp.]
MPRSASLHYGYARFYERLSISPLPQPSAFQTANLNICLLFNYASIPAQKR